MLNENIKAIRKSKDLSQEDLADRLHVVRQTISKWEQGLSVPDADLLISIAEVLETPVSTLLGETVAVPAADDLKAISERLEGINLQLAQRKIAAQKTIHWTLIVLCALMIAVYAALIAGGDFYLNWDFSDPEMAVAGTILHAAEWLFVRIAPVALTGTVIGICLTRKRK